MQTQTMYEQRLCAFVDILGFRDLVQRSLDRPALQRQIRQLLREVVLARPIWERDSPVDLIEARLRLQGVTDPKAEANQLVNEYATAERGSSFSDSLVLSASLNDHAITGFVTSLLFLSRGIAELGKYARGAVCLGPLCHETDLCFGPALINAYDLEKNAEYPRIVFTLEAYAEVSKVQSPSVGPLTSYIREDIDGQRFLDFLNKAALELAGSFREDQMMEIRRELINQLSSSQVPDRVRKKLVWLAAYFNLALKDAPIAGIDPLPTGTSNEIAV
jgi:hypothetical protein